MELGDLNAPDDTSVEWKTWYGRFGGLGGWRELSRKQFVGRHEIKDKKSVTEPEGGKM